MLTEVENARQIAGDGLRRWFRDDDLDLIVWYGDGIEGFQLCYDKQNRERALTWRKNDKYSHNAIDPGDVVWGNKMTPILVADGEFAPQEIASLFKIKSETLPDDIAQLVLQKIRNYQRPR